MKTINLLVAGLIIYLFSSISYAETKHIRCVYLLERWKMNDLAGHGNCPSGERGLGKPWLIEVYSFDLEKGSMSDAVITKDYCTGSKEVLSVKFMAQPDKLIFVEEVKDKYLVELFGKQNVSTINRKDLKNNLGQQCELIETGRNKI